MSQFGYQNLGFGSGVSAASGFLNEASVDFDGTNDYMAVTPSSTIDMYGLSVWFKPDAVISKTSASQVAFGPSGTLWALGFGTIAGAITDELISMYIGAVYGYTSSSASISTDWHHVAIVWSTSSATTSGDGYDIWLDGVKVGNSASNTYGAYSLYTIPASAIHFATRATNTFYYNGKLDEISLFSSALSDADVATIYNSGTPGDLTDLSPAGWWRMGDVCSSTGTNIPDQGSGENDGTLTNSPSFSTAVPS